MIPEASWMKNYRRRVSFAAALLALTLLAAAHVSARSFTLEQAMGSPFPSEFFDKHLKVDN
jgi:hypothetical protein